MIYYYKLCSADMALCKIDKNKSEN